ncbi:phosphodiester glycosidase family protein [Desulfovibrio cuneatus]|uniref:phosphodiester glycosidase family protein n=1 Tax=Desulfovibrio cuneatus TaxID=159728 RepID=UPI000688E4E0|nr:phosphodiester glycosidase family protein [Desulfovibrio cuneatus]
MLGIFWNFSPFLLHRCIARFICSLALLCLSAPPAVAGPTPSLATPLEWRTLAPGLELGTATFNSSPHSTEGTLLAMLRIAPSHFRFSLHMASEQGKALPLAGWGNAHGLTAGINASMYLQDNITSTGYMRGGTHVNNSRVGTNLGAFFVAEPKKPGLPLADLLEASDPTLHERLEEYNVVAQNYRLIARSGRILWSEGGTRTSIAVVGKDTQGRILFILCEEPLTPVELATLLQSLSLSLGTVMYVEGGAQAGLFFSGLATAASAGSFPASLAPRQDANAPFSILKGRQSFLLSKGNTNAPLPNIIGIRPRQE